MLQFRSSSLHRRDDEAGVFYISIQVSFIKIQSSQDYYIDTYILFGASK